MGFDGGSDREGRARRRPRIAALLLASLGAVLTAAAIAGPGAAAPAAGATGPCDATVAVCLLTPPPWIAPQLIRYRAPAGTRLAVEATQGHTTKPLDVHVESEDAETVTISAALAAELSDGALTLTATSATPGLDSTTSGRVATAATGEQLEIAKRHGSYTAVLGLEARVDVAVKLRLELTGRYPAESRGTLASWRKKVTVGGGATHEVALPATDAIETCELLASCRLRAEAEVRLHGHRLDHRSAHADVPTEPERFRGGLSIVHAKRDRSGPGHVYRYGVFVEDGIKVDREDFSDQVAEILYSPKGWTRSGRVAFQQVSNRANATARVILASPHKVDRLCAPLETHSYVSCRNGDNVVLNLDRWRHAVPFWPADRLLYRRYLLNHEMGHRLGQGHRLCPGQGKRAPVMQGQTGGLEGCRPGPWPKSGEVRSLDPSSSPRQVGRRARGSGAGRDAAI